MLLERIRILTDEKEQTNEIRRYLYRVIEQIEDELNRMDGTGNGAEDAKAYTDKMISELEILFDKLSVCLNSDVETLDKLWAAKPSFSIFSIFNRSFHLRWEKRRPFSLLMVGILLLCGDNNP